MTLFIIKEVTVHSVTKYRLYYYYWIWIICFYYWFILLASKSCLYRFYGYLFQLHFAWAEY
jgi:hypothetical protein